MNIQKRVLVVEDDSLVALDLTQSLESFGYQVCSSVDTGARAIASAAELKPDLILMDIRLKGKMDGIEAAQAISANQQIPIIFLTVDAEESTLQRAKLSRPYGYLIKPFDPRELRSTIEITLHRIDSLSGAASDRVETTPVDSDDLEEEFENELTESTDRARMLSKLPLFQELPPESCEQFAALAVERRFDAAEYIVNEGSDPKGGFIVLSGRIGITKTSFDGKELIVASLSPGNTFGLLYTLPKFSQSSAARCQIESRVLWISAKAFEQLRLSFPKVAQRFTEELSHYIALSHQLSSSLAHSKVEGRIVATLMTLLPEIGKGGTAANQGRIYMTRRELADLVGTTPETAVRVTKALERAGLLDLTRPGIIKILDLKRLGAFDLTH